MALTNSQNEIMDGILDEIFDNNIQRIVLKGSAGTGKTWLIKELIHAFKRRKYQYGSVYTTAPTHKALSVLKGKIGTEKEFKQFSKNREENIGKYIVFNTIHSALRLKRQVNKITGKIKFAKDKNDRYTAFDQCLLLIIDEASMLDEPSILNNLEEVTFPIIFVGDDKQIQPVGFDDSPVFTKEWKTFELTEIIRQGEGNPIIDLSRNLHWIKDKKDNMTSEGVGYLFDYDRTKIIQRLAEVNGTDELKYLAYTNAEVNLMNNAVREKLYGKDPGLVQQGESIILNSPIAGHYNNEEIYIDTLEIIETTFPFFKTDYEFKVYFMNEKLYAIHEDSKIDFDIAVRQIKNMIAAQQCNWQDYYEFVEQFADFTYNHAITVHRSQGSTYKTAIINVKNINFIKNVVERNRLLYTAVTRPSNLLILYNA